MARPGPGDACGTEAGVPGALLLLVVDDDRLGHLELAPVSKGTVFDPFPAAEDITSG